MTRVGATLHITAGILDKIVSLEHSLPETRAIAIKGQSFIELPSWDAAMCFSLADPDEEPRGIDPEIATRGIVQENVETSGTDGLRVVGGEGPPMPVEPVSWLPLPSLIGLCQDNCLEATRVSIVSSERQARAVMSIEIARPEVLAGVVIDIVHEIHEGHPAIRKWIEIHNGGHHWIKVDRFAIQPMAHSAAFRARVNLTPDERGAPASIVAMETASKREGILLCSEVPSALRRMDATGSMGYADEHFEWVIGPGERFVSEPVFLYAYHGDVIKTCSSTSTPLDRTIEGPFKDYLDAIVGVRCDPSRMPVPLWCTWSNFHARIDDATVRDQALLASRAGFAGFQIDAGWSNSEDPADWTSGSREAHPTKFPDFPGTCAFVRNTGLKLGLWTSCFRNALAPDLRDVPDGKSFPPVLRGSCFGMSFASRWREYYANDMIELHRSLGATYFKQDLTNIKFGDIARGHDSRTRKESHLRGLRGFFESQDRIHAAAPGAVMLLSHELYWGTPGTPCDLAAIKHAWSFHIPPNDYSGAFPRARRIARRETRLKLNKWQLLAGCRHARERFFAHRGLPLHCIEYYGAATVNKDGSLTPQVQDRQVCSWLVGIPSVFAGDLSSLTPENIARYRSRFEIVARLQAEHGIFKHFQCSGVPSPTDVGWHWWGKLNGAGHGVVVVLRGFLGARARRINVPWVPPGKHFTVRALLAGKDLGIHSSEDLRDGKIKIALPRLSQELLEIAPPGRVAF